MYTIERLKVWVTTGLLFSFIDWLYCIDLFSCIAASLFNKLTYLLTYGTGVIADESGGEKPTLSFTFVFAIAVKHKREKQQTCIQT